MWGQRRNAFLSAMPAGGAVRVFARHRRAGPGHKRFVVPGDADGLSARGCRPWGCRLASRAPTFEDVEVPEENLLGEEGGGFKIAMTTFDHSARRRLQSVESAGRDRPGARLRAAPPFFRTAAFAHEGIQFKLAGGGGGASGGRALAIRPRLSWTSATHGSRRSRLRPDVRLRSGDEGATEAVQVLGGNGYLKIPRRADDARAKVLRVTRAPTRYGPRDRRQSSSSERPRSIWPESMPGARASPAASRPSCRSATAFLARRSQPRLDHLKGGLHFEQHVGRSRMTEKHAVLAHLVGATRSSGGE